MANYIADPILQQADLAAFDVGPVSFIRTSFACSSAALVHLAFSFSISVLFEETTSKVYRRVVSL